VIEVPLCAVAIAWTIAALFCAFDMLAAPRTSQKLFRLFEGCIMAMAALIYWDAAAKLEALPSTNLRFVWITLCIIICAEVISRQSWGSRRNEH
jgi:hypothetical protein